MGGLEWTVHKGYHDRVLALVALGPASCALRTLHLALDWVRKPQVVAEALLQHNPGLIFEVDEEDNTVLHLAIKRFGLRKRSSKKIGA